MNVLTVIELQAYLAWGVTVVTCLCDTQRSTLSATKKEKSPLEVFMYCTIIRRQNLSLAW